MKKINRIFQTLTILCLIAVLGACKNDNWSEVELNPTPVYELSSLTDVVTSKAGDVSKFSVYRELFDLIVWKNEYQTLRINKIEFFTEEDEPIGDLPGWLEIDPNKEKYLRFSFDEVYTVTEEFINPETGEQEEKEVEKRRLYIFEGKKEVNTSGGFGHLTISEEDGTKVEYEAALNDVFKHTDLK